jgi:hypothetical protein
MEFFLTNLTEQCFTYEWILTEMWLKMEHQLCKGSVLGNTGYHVATKTTSVSR